MKKVLMYFGIVIGVMVFFVMGLVVMMMLAPGVEIFGIKYIAQEVGQYSNIIRQPFTDKDIYIYAYDAPISITFEQEGPIGITYVQNFQGFTHAENAPGITLLNEEGKPFDVNSDSELHIHLSQYKTFAWANVRAFSFNLNLPQDYISYGNITIETQNSEITVSGIAKQLNSFTAKTKRSIKILNNLTISKASFYSEESLTLGSNVQILNSLTAEIANEGLFVENAVKNGSNYGNINFKTAGGHLTFNSCYNLTMESGSGRINAPTSGTIHGNLQFTTSAGSVDIKNILGTDNKITSVSGNIDIGSCAGNLQIETNRSEVNLGTVNNVAVKTTTGDINIGKATGSVEITSLRNGDVTCGVINGNASIITNTGEIVLTDIVVGNLKMETGVGNMQMVSCYNLEVTSQEGNLIGYNGAQVTARGTAKISSAKGNISINKVLGLNAGADYDNTIETCSGNIELGLVAGRLKVTSRSSNISVDSVKFIDVETYNSTIVVNNAPNGANIVNECGDISVGSTKGVANSTGDLYIKSKRGKVSAYNTTGAVTLISDNEVVLVNRYSSSININTIGDTRYGKGKVTATNLQGDVKVYSEQNVNLSFLQISGNVRVDTKTSNGVVNIDASCAAASTVNYWLQSQKNAKCYVYHGPSLQEINSVKKQEIPANIYKITVITTYASAMLKLGS